LYSNYKDPSSNLKHSDYKDPESQLLFLPSHFTNAETRIRYGLEELAEVEVALRKGQAHDAIRDLQDAILHIKSCIGVKYKNSGSQQRNLRSTKYIRGIRDRKDGWAEKYRHARQCLLDLGVIDTQSIQFPTLTDEDMYLKNIQEDVSLGQASLSAGWIWGTQWYDEKKGSDLKSVLEGMSVVTFVFDFHAYTTQIIGKRVLWHRNKADTLRFIEEVELLEAEFC
jgi:hypothetical protein